MGKTNRLNREDIQDILGLTPMQEGMLVLYLREPKSLVYFEQLSLTISGRIDFPIFQKAWQFVVDANQSLRTLFRWEKMSSPTQVILKHHQPVIHEHNLLADRDREDRLERLKEKDRQERFDLSAVPFRLALCRLGEERYEMIVSHHHILYDGWSSGIILKEFFSAFNDLSAGRALKKPDKTGFKEYMREVSTRHREKERVFWRSYLAGFEGMAGLSVKRRGIEIETGGIMGSTWV